MPEGNSVRTGGKCCVSCSSIHTVAVQYEMCIMESTLCVVSLLGLVLKSMVILHSKEEEDSTKDLVSPGLD